MSNYIGTRVLQPICEGIVQDRLVCRTLLRDDSPRASTEDSDIVDRPRKTGTRERERNPEGKKVLKKEETKESELELSTKGAD
jgi:hypothetical protein